ncbi:MAG: hypothetical protein ACRD1T_14305, partial [Acidimicrobiia bacterium]
MKGRIGFRAKTFFVVFGVSAAVLLLAAAGINRALRQQTSERIARDSGSDPTEAFAALERQQRSVRHVTLAALGLALVSALTLGWLSAAILARRMDAITQVANRYSAGDLSPPRADYGTDEVGA